ncbi:MAG: VOC family protein [Bacillota bacterium]
MAQIIAYLSFNGNCREAMSFYRDILGGELRMQSVGETPVAGQMPAEAHQKIMHALLTGNGFVLMASDSLRGNLTEGSSISLLLSCSGEEEINRLFSGLSSGGNVTEPLNDTFWGARFGALKDKFGISWMLNFEKPKS